MKDGGFECALVVGSLHVEGAGSGPGGTRPRVKMFIHVPSGRLKSMLRDASSLELNYDAHVHFIHEVMRSL